MKSIKKNTEYTHAFKTFPYYQTVAIATITRITTGLIIATTISVDPNCKENDSTDSGLVNKMYTHTITPRIISYHTL